VIAVEQRLGPLRDRLVFFAVGEDVARLAAECGAGDLVRVRHARDAGPVDGRRVSDALTSCIELDREEEALYRGLDAKSCRYEIRKAEKLGGRLELLRNDKRAVEDFRLLQNRLVARTRHRGPLSRRRYEQYRRVSDVLVAYVDGSPVAGHLVVCDPATARVRLVFSASTRFEQGERRQLSGPVNRWLHWQELLLYRGEGYRTYDFGGVNPTSSIGRFKLSFGGTLERGTNVVLAGPLASVALTLADGASTARRRLRRRPQRASASS
jgi:lipid II:glycine glycyltransferase (peptidoglycan interpeptide bridge formation enzyme)